MKSHTPRLGLVVISALLVLAGGGRAFGAGWSVTFEQGLAASTGQAPSDSMGAKIIEGCPSGSAVHLEKKARLAYPSTTENGEPVVPPVTGILEFDFFPEPGQHSHQAAFDSGNIVLLGKQGDLRLRATLKLDDDSEIKLVSKRELVPREWTKITLKWDLTQPAGQVMLFINGELADRKAIGPNAARLKPAAPNLSWGMFLWGGNPWNGTYDNLRLE